jgi:hypothetical protein
MEVDPIRIKIIYHLAYNLLSVATNRDPPSVQSAAFLLKLRAPHPAPRGIHSSCVSAGVGDRLVAFERTKVRLLLLSW